MAVPGRLAYRAVAALNLQTILVWATARTVGMPFGPDAGQPVPIGAPDLVATFLEVLSVVALLTLLWGSASGRRPAPAAGMPARAYVALASIPVYILILICVAVVPAAVGHADGAHSGHAQHQHDHHTH